MPVHLHAHSWFSLLEASASPEALLTRAAAQKHTSLALTDTNNLYGAVAFVDAARALGVRPLLGACLRQGKVRCVALMADVTGYASLCRILSRLHLEGQEDGAALRAALLEHSQGLHLLLSDLDLVGPLRDIYPGRLWVEVIRPRRLRDRPGHACLTEQTLCAKARTLGLPLIASQAVHLAAPEEYHTFRLTAAVRQGTLLEQLPARLSITAAHHLTSPEAFEHWFADLPDALKNTERLAEQLSDQVLPSKVILPPARVPRRLGAPMFLRLLCERGLKERDLANDPGAKERTYQELAVIEAEGLSPYFLVVRDIARHARARGHTMALRGSAGNSLVCYLLGITEVDPLRFGLKPDRFLYPGRPDLPDIDLDFDWKVRDAVIDYVFERYGHDHVAMISSHICLQPRSAFREASKVHGLSNEQISRLIDTLPEFVEDMVEGQGGQAGSLSLREKRLPPLPVAFPLEAERWPRLIQDARLLQGRPHHLSVHPGGVVITPGPIANHAPLQRAAKGIVITQFEKDAAERLGLVKIDLLGNRALGTVDEIQRMLHARAENFRGSGVAPELLLKKAWAKSKAWAGSPSHKNSSAQTAILDLLQRGDTLGVNQLESPAMRHLLVQMRPRGIEDVIAALAVIRPGAASGSVKESYLRRRRGLETWTPHPLLQPLLAENHGYMVYEDDALRVIEALTGYSIPETHRFYKRLRKVKNPQQEKELAGEFLRCAAAREVPRALAEEQFVFLSKFRHYAFCKSHAVSYGLIAWQALGLKARHPCHFWAAALNNNMGMYPRRVYLEALKRAGIRVLLPCINRSQPGFSVEEGMIRVGLDAVAALPEEVKARLLAERGRGGPFFPLRDFLQRVGPGPEALALLIRCGALDGLNPCRPALFLEAELDGAASGGRPPPEGRKYTRGLPPPGLFPEEPLSLTWAPNDYVVDQRRLDEWELLGFVVGPPLLSLFAELLPRDRVKACDLKRHVGRRVQVAGVVATHRHTHTLDGRPMQFITLEDETGLIEINLFPGLCAPLPYLQMGPYLAEGRLQDELDVVTLHAEKVRPLREA